ncbi:MAG: cation:proton antiporter [Bacteroidales bacterium]|nr:cation:proton antiporter [Bacteroidales bacterium]MBR2478518.1 cation:proton antiporter [Bacteroidales bacterium]
MNHLLSDLALILIVAGIVTVLFKKLKQPLVLGYIVAGVLTGPYISFIPTVGNIESVDFWGKIGVIFLLFGLGLEFSFKKLKKVGGPGFITVFTEVVMMFCMGILVGRVLDWSWVASIFLGGMLSISSTSIIIKAFDDMGVKNKKFTQMVFGALVVEDLVAILILVLLPALVLSKSFNGVELADKVANLALFLLLWFTGGVFFIPTIFKKLKQFLSDETLIVVSLGLCLMMVVITVNAGISEALGAFVMGSILSGTIQSDKIVKVTKPIKDFFGAIFFVSVGMLVDPSAILEYWPQVLLISAVIIVAKPLGATLGLLFSGQTLKNAILSGVCLCQIGEFSFIIVQMGLDHNVVPKHLYPVIVTVSILTTFITPYWIKMGEPLYNFIYRSVKPQWRVVIERLGTGRKTLNQEGEWNKLLKSYALRLFIYVGWLLFVGILFTQILYPQIVKWFGEATHIRILSFVANLLAMMPFLWGLLKRKDSDGAFDKIWQDQKFARGPLVFMMMLKYIIAIIAISITSSRYISMGFGAGLTLCAIIIAAVLASKKIKEYYARIEDRFLTNLNSEGGRRSLVLPRVLADEIHIEKVEVEPNSSLQGKSISQIHHSKKTGALVIQIVRGMEILDLPPNTEIIFPMDILIILGTDKQIMDFKEAAEEHHKPVAGGADLELFQITLQNSSPLVGENGNITHIREKFGVLMVGLEGEESNTFIRTTSATIIKGGDTVWVVGEKNRVKDLR